MKRNTWYYAVTCYKGVNQSHEDRWTSVYSCYYTPFEITFADVYTLTEEAKNAIFKRNMRAPTVIAEETLSVEVDCDANINPSKYGIDEDITCTSSDEGIATVDNDGNVHGVKAGTCTITVSAGGCSFECTVTVTPKPPTLEVAEGSVKEVTLSLDNIKHEQEGHSAYTDLEINSKGHLIYKSKDGVTDISSSTRNGGFKIVNTDGRIANEDYMVFVIKYSDKTELTRVDGGKTYTGVWFLDYQGYRPAPHYNYGYTCIDGEFKNCGTGSGTMASMQNDKTNAETWYYLVSPTDGHDLANTWDNYYGSLYGNFNFTIAHIYAVSTKVRDALVGGYYNKDIISAEKKLVMDLGTTQSLNAEVKKLGDTPYALTYSSDDESVATVTDGMVETKKIGKCTITISAEGLDAVSCDIEVIDSVPPFISEMTGVTPITETEGTPLLTLIGEQSDKGRLEQDAETGYWRYWVVDAPDDNSTRVSLANVNIPDEEYFVLLCRFAAGTKLDSEYGLCFETLPSGGGERYYAVFDKDGYDYTKYDGSKPNGTVPLDANKWYFLVESVRGGFEKLGNYYTPFDFTIAKMYTVTQAARDMLFHVNIRPGDTVPAPRLCAKEEIEMHCGKTANLDAQIMYPQTSTYSIFYEVMDGSTIVTVSDDGVVTAGNAAGTCKIKISAEGLEPVYCKVTVKEGNEPHEFSGEGITPLGIDCFVRVNNSGDAVTLAVGEDGYLKYSSATEGWGGDNEIKFKDETNNVPAEEYLVIQFKYSPETELNGGLWFAFYGPNETGPYEYDYFMVVDNEGNDYTSYDMTTQKGPYGSSGTEPEKWYYLVAYNKGQMNKIKVYYAPFEYTIAGVYTITAEKKDAWIKKS